MRYSRRFVCALAVLALAISGLLGELGSSAGPAAFEAGRSRAAAPKVDSQPAAAQGPHSAPGPRPTGAQSEISTTGRAPRGGSRPAGDPAREAKEIVGEETSDAEAIAGRVEFRDTTFPVELDVPVLGPCALSFRATGFDPDGPRALTLWRVGDEGPARLAETVSAAQGDLDFGSFLIPVRGLALVATAHGRPPTPEERRGALSVRSEVPLPRIEWLESAEDGLSFEVQPSIAEGSVVLADADEVLIARFEVSGASTGPSPRLAIDLETDDDVVWIAHELPDGRRSSWRILRLDTRRSAPGVVGEGVPGEGPSRYQACTGWVVKLG